MSQSGQKTVLAASKHDFRSSPNNGNHLVGSVGRFRADFVAEIGIPTARDGWWIF